MYRNISLEATGPHGNANNDTKPGPKAGSIAGGVSGGIIALALIGMGIFFLKRRHHRGVIEDVPGAIHSLGARYSIEPFKDDPTLFDDAIQDVTIVGSHREGVYKRDDAIYSGTNASSTSRTSQVGGMNTTAVQQETGSSSSTAFPGIAGTRGDLALRDEVEALRREVERIRQRDVLSISEAPPSYADDTY